MNPQDLEKLKERLLAIIDAINYLRQFERDGRKYDVGDKVNFTDDDGNQVPGVVHGVRYQADKNGNHHSFEYIMVPEEQHRSWWQIVKSNEKKIAKHRANIEKYKGSVNKDEPYHAVNMTKVPDLEELDAIPPMKQHIRVFEED